MVYLQNSRLIVILISKNQQITGELVQESRQNVYRPVANNIL